MGSFVMGGPPKPKTVVIPGQKYPEACVWQPTSNLLVLFKFFVGYSFLVSRPSGIDAMLRVGLRDGVTGRFPRGPAPTNRARHGTMPRLAPSNFMPASSTLIILWARQVGANFGLLCLLTPRR